MKDLTGNKYNKLLVLNFEFIKSGGYSYWNCLCDCGEYKIVLGSHLTSNQTKSCGCIRSHSDETQTAWKTLHNTYQLKAKKRKLEFLLSVEDFKEITTKNCSYCGRVPKDIFNPYLNKEGDKLECTGVSLVRANKASILRNGIDREDNLKGYTLNNSVPCCKICNRAKSDMSLKEWYEYLEDLVKFRRNDNE